MTELQHGSLADKRDHGAHSLPHHAASDELVFQDMEHVPHEAQLSLGRVAVEIIRERDRHATDVALAEQKVEELKALRPDGFIPRFRQRKALKSWLSRHNYPDYDSAHNVMEGKIAGAKTRHEALDQEITDLRTIFTGFNDAEKRLADLSLRHHGLPEEIVTDCDATAKEGDRRNIIDWLATPKQQEPKTSASNEQVEAVLMWNANFTEQIAADTELVKQTAQHYQVQVQQRVRQGALDKAFADQPFEVTKVVVGDMLDRKFIGNQGGSRAGQYFPETKVLAVWPYELPNIHTKESLVHFAQHELTHSKGGFNTPWINEAYTERFVLILNGNSPDQKSNIYNLDRGVIKALQEGAPRGMSDRQASAVYAGPDHAANEVKLGEYYKQAYYGIDVLNIVNGAYLYFAETFTIRSSKDEHNKGLTAAALTALFISQHASEACANPPSAKNLAAKFREDAAKSENIINKIAFNATAHFYDEAAKLNSGNNK